MLHPPVSVLLPLYNEADHIDECLASLAAQDYPGRWETIVADGGSTDGTSARVEAWHDRLPSLRVIDNPRRRQSDGLNLAAEVATGEILVRADGHTTYAPDYLRRSVAGLDSTGAAAVGGLQIALGRSPFGKAVAQAMRSPLGVGAAPYRRATEAQEADTVYLGAFRRSDFLELGGFRTLPTGVAEDADFYFRMRSGGGRVLLDPAIRTTYRPRETPSEVARQYYRYGAGKAEMLYVNGRWPSWRPLAPALLVSAMVAGALVGWITGAWWLLGLVAGAWVIGLLIAGRGRALVALAAGIMQASYGLGLVRGLLRSPRRVRAAAGLG